METDTTQTQSRPSEPVASEPVASEPVQSEPVQSEPVQSEPAPSEPVLSEPSVGDDDTETKTDGDDGDDTTTKTDGDDDDCIPYPECPPQPDKEESTPLFVPITTEICPVISVLVNKPKFCLQNKADTIPCYFKKKKHQ